MEIGEPFKNLKWEIIFDTQIQNEIILLTGVWSEILMIQNGKFVIDIFDSDGYFLIIEISSLSEKLKEMSAMILIYVND